ncbi:MAG: hypothetical protein IPL55_21555 [Saprospiraceae bacterium]|nr:hypothetical protein [Saprospiraceae bacterium]
MEAIFDFLKNIFSFRDITLSSLAVLSVVLILLILLTYKTLNKNAIYLILAVIMGVLIYMVIRGENNRKPIIDEINQKPPRLTLIVHEASSHTNRFIESRGKIILYSEDENKKASYNIGKSGIINIDSMLPWTANDSSGIQILINSLDSTKENALVIGNRYFIKANDTVMVGYTYLTINKNKSVVPDEPINVKSNEIGIYFNKKMSENCYGPIQISRYLLLNRQSKISISAHRN